VLLIDFEVGHYGDPAFDLGFFLTHLVLKSIWSGARQSEYLALATEFWHTYRETMLAAGIGNGELTALERRTMFNLAGCMLARVDGKSPVEYLSTEQQDRVRLLARGWLVAAPQTWDEALAGLGGNSQRAASRPSSSS
jgi:5-methylthioribose kinase